ncbi:MAG: hypothetical protein WB949_16765 [Candidatus Acidiferrales bacterium]
MVDILEQLERDSPSRPGKDLPAVQFNLLSAVFLTVLSAASVIYHVDQARLHHVHGWQINAIYLSLAILMPWTGALGGYGKLKKSALVAGTSAEVLRSFLIHGSWALVTAQAALCLALDVTLHLH